MQINLSLSHAPTGCCLCQKLEFCVQEVPDNAASAAAAVVKGGEDDEGSAGEDVPEGEFELPPREVFVVDTIQKAQQAAARLHALHAANPSMFFACDTEVSTLELFCCCVSHIALLPRLIHGSVLLYMLPYDPAFNFNIYISKAFPLYSTVLMARDAVAFANPDSS